MQEGYSKMVKNIIKAQITIITIAFLCGCGPTAAPANNLASDSNSTLLETDVISSSSVEYIVLLHTFSGHSKRVLDVAFSARGEFLASSSQDMKIILWDINSGQAMHTFQMESVDMADIDISTNENMLASGEAIWDLESTQEIHTLERGSQIPAFVDFSPDGSLLALGRLGEEIKLWDVTSGQAFFIFAEQEEKRTKRMEFSPDGTLLAAGVIDGTVRLYDTESGEIANTLTYRGETDIHDIAFSSDGEFLASGGRVPAVILWDVESGEVVRTFRVQDTVLSIDFSPDGTILAATGGAEKAVLLWDVESGELLHSLPHNDQCMAIAFSNDGRLLAAGCFDNQLYLWGIPTNP
jgi:WD40 repeat protein